MDSAISPKTVWVARGPCAQCARAIALRVAGPGSYPVRCGGCSAVTPLVAVEIRVNAQPPTAQAPDFTPVHGPRPGAPPMPPVVPQPPRPAPSTASARRFGPKAALVVGVVLAATAGLLAYALLAGGGPADPIDPAPGSDGGGEGGGSPLGGNGTLNPEPGIEAAAPPGGGSADAPPTVGEWVSVEKAFRLNFTAEAVAFVLDVHGTDADGREVPREKLADSATYFFAQSAHLAESSANVSGWTPCEPLDCRYVAPLASIVYFNQDFPGLASGAYAFNATTRELFLLAPVSGWMRIVDWEAHLASFREVRAEPSENASGYSVAVYVEYASSDAGRFVNVSLVQGGRVVEESQRAVQDFFRRDFPSLAMFDVDSGPLVVRITDPVTGDGGEQTIDEATCASKRVRVVALFGAEGPISFERPSCD